MTGETNMDRAGRERESLAVRTIAPRHRPGDQR